MEAGVAVRPSVHGRCTSLTTASRPLSIHNKPATADGVHWPPADRRSAAGRRQLADRTSALNSSFPPSPLSASPTLLRVTTSAASTSSNCRRLARSRHRAAHDVIPREKTGSEWRRRPDLADEPANRWRKFRPSYMAKRVTPADASRHCSSSSSSGEVPDELYGTPVVIHSARCLPISAVNFPAGSMESMKCLMFKLRTIL